MTLYLSDMPIWLSIFLIVVLPTLAAMAGPILVRKCFGLEKLVINNEVAGFKFAVVGVIYAVVLGFAVVVVWEKFRDAEAAVVQEASALVAIDRLSQGLSPEAGASMRQHLIDYGSVRDDNRLARDGACQVQRAGRPGAGRSLQGSPCNRSKDAA